MSSLAEGKSLLLNTLRSRDTKATIRGCRALGVNIVDKPHHIAITGRNTFVAPDDVINVENSGTTMRFLTAMSALAEKGYTVITGDESTRRRPMEPMIFALRNLGVQCYSTRLNGSAPIVVQGGGIDGGRTEIAGSTSSQFLSGLLISGVYAQSELEIKVTGKQVSRPYIESTIATIKKFGISIKKSDDYRVFHVSNGKYTPTSFTVPGDFSTAALILSAGTMLGDEIILSGLDFSLPQGDSRIVDILKEMDAELTVSVEQGQIRVTRSESLEGGEFDLSDTPDLLPVLSILALRSKSPVRIYGVSHTRFKETDRLTIIASEMAKLGVNLRMTNDELIIHHSGKLKNACLDAHDDHRLFMCFVIAAMMTEKSIVKGASSVDVSYPQFISEMKRLGGQISYS
ncbi:MAG: 3-phosphoshikimate 1-carboxyvinyltransferase [Thermoproteota archaeon]|nr:3-phosphoshikimate 1-carboxyvinyltransferase [Thermoproteota archaeon]